jgi:hypothetical protein
VRLNGSKVLDAPLSKQPAGGFVVPAAAAEEFHTLELSTSPEPGPQSPGVRLLRLAAVDAAEQVLRLVA